MYYSSPIFKFMEECNHENDFVENQFQTLYGLKIPFIWLYTPG